MDEKPARETPYEFTRLEDLPVPLRKIQNVRLNVQQANEVNAEAYALDTSEEGGQPHYAEAKANFAARNVQRGNVWVPRPKPEAN